MKELEGKYLNGYRIVKVEKDPFIQGQINLWTDETKQDFLGNKEVVKFYVRDYPSGASIYQEQVDKENYQLKNGIKEFKKWLEDEKEATIFDYHFAIEDVLNKLNELLGSDK